MTIKELIAELNKIQDQDQEIAIDKGDAFFKIEEVVGAVAEEGGSFYYIAGDKIY